MTAIARFTASRAAAIRVTNFSGLGGAAAFSLDGGAELARTVAAVLGHLDDRVLGVEVVLHDTRLDVPAEPGEPIPNVISHLADVVAGAAVPPEGVVTCDEPASRDDGPHHTGPAPHLAVTDLEQRDRIVALMHAVDGAVTGRVREARMDGQEYTDAYVSTLRLLAEAGMRHLDDSVELEVVYRFGVIVARMAAAAQVDLGTTPTGWAHAALESSGWTIAPSSPAARAEARVEAFARHLARRYRDSDTVPEGQIRVMWIPVTERLLATAGVSDLAAALTTELVEQVARGVYAKMTESDGAGFDTSSQRSRWVSWTHRALVASGWEVQA
ncbi:hypothetical protein [Cellulosimicrobium sp. Marseille-Q4280]|uniref:hypothetical protein n=1 Tax=Cellulosimicrobium sp. Marseille-Q4280 TaxID=2937992 RepID=UPI0020421600|nr:hypothetical protein [Cellulosimicrobium sp. Marseille-Q4280]